MKDQEGGGERVKRGIRCKDVGFSTWMVASRVEERIKDMSAQGTEKIDHVWMEVWTKWDQKNEGVGRNAL